MLSRRDFLRTVPAAAAFAALSARAQSKDEFKIRYTLSSALYGTMPLDVILPEVAKVGAESIDIWCKAHGDQREQATALGEEAFAALLKKHGVRVGSSTRYPLGPFKLQEEMAWVKKHGGDLVICGCVGPKNPEGAAAKAAVAKFLEDMKPHVAKAAELGVTIAVENHVNQALHHPDSIKAFADLNTSPNLGLAFAPHHLHDWQDQIPALIRYAGAKNLPFIYFQEHSEGIFKKTSKEIELQQLPGFGGGLDYRLVVKALRDVRFKGVAEIFMHPTPRGIPILPTAGEVTAAVNKSRAYLDKCILETA
jgi:sugar phosphate isomerase/epimerase